MYSVRPRTSKGASLVTEKQKVLGAAGTGVWARTLSSPTLSPTTKLSCWCGMSSGLGADGDAKKKPILIRRPTAIQILSG